MKQPSERKIWQVKEIDRREVICSQTRNIPAHCRKEAKEIYSIKHKLYPFTRLAATVISNNMSEWYGEE